MLVEQGSGEVKLLMLLILMLLILMLLMLLMLVLVLVLGEVGRVRARHALQRHFTETFSSRPKHSAVVQQPMIPRQAPRGRETERKRRHHVGLAHYAPCPLLGLVFSELRRAGAVLLSLQAESHRQTFAHWGPLVHGRCVGSASAAAVPRHRSHQERRHGRVRRPDRTRRYMDRYSPTHPSIQRFIHLSNYSTINLSIYLVVYSSLYQPVDRSVDRSNAVCCRIGSCDAVARSLSESALCEGGKESPSHGSGREGAAYARHGVAEDCASSLSSGMSVSSPMAPARCPPDFPMPPPDAFCSTPETIGERHTHAEFTEAGGVRLSTRFRCKNRGSGCGKAKGTGQGLRSSCVATLDMANTAARAASERRRESRVFLVRI